MYEFNMNEVSCIHIHHLNHFCGQCDELLFPVVQQSMSRTSILSGLSNMVDDEIHNMGIYKGNIVTVYRSDLASIKLKPEDHIELNEVS